MHSNGVSGIWAFRSHVISDRGFVALAISVILLMNNCGGGVGVLEEFI